MRAAGLGAIGNLDPATCRQLEKYVELLLDSNATLNLTAARSRAAVEEHLRDSLTVLPYVRDPLVDIGSGGGFPAIPLAIVTGFAVTAIEAVAKKARFLQWVVDELLLKVTVVAARAEEAAHRPELRERFGSATARGIAGAATVLELTVPFLEEGGTAVLQRGRLSDDERAAACDAALVLGAEIAGEVRTGGLSDERRILLARKTAASAPRFPRRAGTPAKRPLGGRPNG